MTPLFSRGSGGTDSFVQTSFDERGQAVFSKDMAHRYALTRKVRRACRLVTMRSGDLHLGGRPPRWPPRLLV